MIVGTQGFYGLPVMLTAQGGADVVAGAGATTTSLSIGGVTSAFIQPHPGLVVPVLYGVLVVAYGATAPASMNITFATTAGTAIDTQTFNVSSILANATAEIPIVMLGVASASAWLGAGLTPMIQVAPVTNGVTVRLTGSRVLFGLIPGGA